MTSALAGMDRLLSNAYVEGLRSMSLDQVRACRAECQEVEVSLSYTRRIVQGRLDIVYAHLESRSGGKPADLGRLVSDLPDILGEHVHAPGLGRLPLYMIPDVESGDLTAEIDAIADVGVLSNLETLSSAELGSLAERLSALEKRYSAQRRALHERIDLFQAELVDRYKSGEANVSNLLK